MIRASGPWRSSSARAWSTLVARSYSTGAGTCMRSPLVVFRDGRAARDTGQHGNKRSLIVGRVTLTQLEAFVLVARLGSVTAAARTLGVSEPAVSGALAALRQQLGDNLLERSPQGMALTAGGRRLVAIGSQMIALAAEAEDAIRQAQGAPDRLRVVATSTVAESVAPGPLAAFGARAGAVDVTLGVASSDEIPAVLQERLADVALGPQVSAADL